MRRLEAIGDYFFGTLADGAGALAEQAGAADTEADADALGAVEADALPKARIVSSMTSPLSCRTATVEWPLREGAWPATARWRRASRRRRAGFSRKRCAMRIHFARCAMTT
jgi:hypothetical protein